MIRVTRKEKRTKESKINFFAEFIKIQKHFFSDFTKKLREVKEVRNTSYITYEPDILLFTVIMKNIAGISSMNRMTRDFNTYDTINNFLKKLEIEELEKIRDYMIRNLLRKRTLEKMRLDNMDLCQYSKHIFSNFLYSFTPC